jgi:O-antigen/teichoic acid export membrane protein
VGNYATGIYNATYKLISVLALFYGVYTAVIFPVMSRLFKNDEKALVLLLEKSIKYYTLIIVNLQSSF